MPKGACGPAVQAADGVGEAGHGKLRHMTKPARGFKTLKTAYAKIKGFKVTRTRRRD